MTTVDSMVEKLLGTYPYGYEIKDRKYIVWNMGKEDVWEYETAEDLIADWYEIMKMTYDDHGFWTDEEMQIAKEMYDRSKSK